MIIILLNAIDVFAYLLTALIFIRIIVSWLPINRDNVIIRLIYSLTEPILSPIRKLISKSPLGGPGMMLDFSPILAYLAIEIVKSVIKGILISFI